MILNIDTERDIGMIRPREFALIQTRLTEAEFDAAVAHINQKIDEAGADIATAGWLPGADWTGTPLEPLYAKVAGRDQVRSAMLFGILVWHTVRERPERWACGRYQVNGRDIGSMTYFIPERWRTG